MIELWIQGYKDNPTKYFLKKCGFKLKGIKSNEFLIVFASYSKYEIPIGTTLEWFACADNKSICITVKIHTINLGFGPPQTSVPKGYKSLLLLTGRPEYIAELKSELNPTNDWHESNAKPIRAFNIEKSKNFLNIDFPYVPGDPFW